MSHQSEGDDTAPTTHQLREQVEHTRDELGQTVEALAAKADLKAQAKDKATEIREQAAGAAALVTDRLREKATQTAELLKDKAPEPVLDTAAHAAVQAREGALHARRLAAAATPDEVREMVASATTRARANRVPLLAAAAAIGLFLLLRRTWRRK
ncbi:MULTISPECIES: DUF3618 domain-containing protein [unclassified Streptomyces]|uniref:DUF3618 domain-containing protein n=1 Tax=unclassified Streptomyces TaxID=2593676 RepID=UPI00368D96A6